MAPIRLSAPVLALAALLTVAPAVTPAVAQGDIGYRLDAIQRELDTLRAQAGLAGGGGVGASGVALNDVVRLENEIKRLTNMVEQLRHEVDRIRADTEQQLGDLIFRVTELEGGDLGTVVTPRLGAGTAGVLEGGAIATTAPQVAVTERTDLDLAVADVREGRFDQGEERLRKFLLDYPASPLESEARFWLGESLFTRGYFQDAARAFLSGYNVNKEGEYAARNLYRLGSSLGRLGQRLDACLTLEEVGKQFPTAPADLLTDVADEASRLGCGT